MRNCFKAQSNITNNKGDIDMTLKDEYSEADILRIIRSWERHIETLQYRIIDDRFDIQASRKTIAFWKKELKKVQKKAKTKKAKTKKAK